MQQCYYTKPVTTSQTATANTSLFNQNQYFINCLILVGIDTGFWCLLQYGTAIAREMMYEEPFMYSPLIGKKGMVKNLLVSKLGP